MSHPSSALGAPFRVLLLKVRAESLNKQLPIQGLLG